MARRVRDSRLETRAARAKLPRQTKPFFSPVSLGLHLGYRKGARGGRWVTRIYNGNGAYRLETIGDADDVRDANGTTVLTFWQAQEKAREMQQAGEISTSPYTVKDALDEYLEWMEVNRKSARRSLSFSRADRAARRRRRGNEAQGKTDPRLVGGNRGGARAHPVAAG